VGWFLRACCCPIALRQRQRENENENQKTTNQRKQNKNQTPANSQIDKIDIRRMRNGAIKLIVVEIAP
jgi:hypothetical protein